MPKPQDTKDVYQYTALGRREIRVVLLHPWDSIDGIRCEMTHVSLGDNPKYEALSYTWGSATNKAFIKVGSTWLSVTQNLFNALHALSPPSSHRIIWIDAMCINQNDPTERDHQVAFMKDIYTRASRVIVWLGSAADNSDAVMDYIGTIIPEPNLTEHKSWESVSALLSRPWFSRVWIQQE
ncbi:HET-domain-containing protein, partial [Polyplosphaeria fusca]